MSKFVDRMGFLFQPSALSHIRQRFGPWDVDRFASPTNATCKRFNAMFDAVGVEAVDALAQNWSTGVSFALPDFHRLDEVLDVIERDEADAILVVPCWHRKAWWHRLHSRRWRERVVDSERMPGTVLVANNPHCFFGEQFATDLLVLRTGTLGPAGVSASDGPPQV